MDAQELIKEILLDVSKDQAIIKADQAAMKEDLKIHIKRTNQMEVELKWIHRQIWLVHGALGLIVFAVSVYKALGK